MRAVGSSLPRMDAPAKVTGAALYPGDISLPNQAWMKVVFAHQAPARLRRLDVSRAQAAPGVIAVLTAQDVPVNAYGLIMPDQPVLCGPGSTPQAEIVRWIGDQICLVVAESQAQAEAAAQWIAAEYEPLAQVTDLLAAMQPGAPQVHDYAHHPFAQKEPDSNVLLEYQLRSGEIETGFAQADVIVEHTYHTHAQEHAYLQPEAGLAHILPDGRIEVIVAGQWMHEDRQQIAYALGLAEEQIRVRYPAIGGAFGGREDTSVQIVLALAAWKTGRPVKTVWSREESILGHHKRHPYILHAKWGATREGKIVAAQMDLTSDCGAYAYTSTKVLGNSLLACLGPYQIPHVRVNARTVYTHNCPGGAFRGFGGPQAHFAAEMQVSKLAQALHMDPVELRMHNLWQEGATLPTGSPLPAGCSISQILAEAAHRGGWTKTVGGSTVGSWQRALPAPTPNPQSLIPNPQSPTPSLQATRTHTARGIGIAASFKNVGFSLGFPEQCQAWVELQGETKIENARVGVVGADVGQGAHTAFRQIAAQTLNLPPEQVHLHTEDTDVTGSSGSASASRMTFMAGNAIQGAAALALQAWANEERPARGDFVFHPRPTTGYAPQTGAGDPNITYGYCAQVAEVEVDLETGHVTVKRLVSVNDVGKAINPQLIEGQIEGAVAQSVGWTLLENFVQQEGRVLTRHLSTYLIPGILDVVEEIEPVILEFPDPQGPLGARGMAEMPFIPTAPAIGAAIYNAIGVWIDDLPYTPERVWRALQGCQLPHG